MPPETKPAAIILSHGGRQSAADAEIVEAAQRLASAGYWVIVPDHASVHPQSRQPLADAERPNFYGDELAAFYGPGRRGRPAAAGLARRREPGSATLLVHPQGGRRTISIVIAGTGIGGVDACLAAAL